MPKYVAFLRAINVGGHTVKMDQLRSAFKDLGFTNVETFIASGNVIFDSKSKNAQVLEEKIEKHLKNVFGYEVATFIRSTEEVATIAAASPFTGKALNPQSTLYIGFLAKQPGAKEIKQLLTLRSATDDFHVRERELYWLMHGKFRESGVTGALLEKTLGTAATLRNVNTVKKIAAKYDQGSH